MLLNLIISLGISIIFTETPAIDCNGELNEGCYHLEDNTIYLSYKSKDIDRLFYHELGHALFMKDEHSRTLIKDYKPIRNYCTEKPLENYPNMTNCLSGYKTEEEILNEMVANYFVEYIYNPKNFSVHYPILYIYFRDTLNKIK